ncbi:MAG: hypothetical protein ACLS3C_11020 [Oscillospiraceae bacterium]
MLKDVTLGQYFPGPKPASESTKMDPQNQACAAVVACTSWHCFFC